MENPTTTTDQVVDQRAPAPAAPKATDESTPSAATIEKPATGREEVYKQIYGEPKAVEPAAVAEPVKAVEPAAAKAAEPASDPTVAELKAQIAQLTESVRALAPKAAEPEKNPAQAAADAQDWLELIKSGKREEADAALARMIADKTSQSIISQAVEQYRAETDITAFVSDLRTKNPDLADLEDLIVVKAKSKLEAAYAQGKIKSITDHVTQYKAAVNTATEEARVVAQRLRASGKEEATIRQKEVVAASSPAPSAIDASRGVDTSAKQAQPESAEDYLAKRAAATRARQGLGL